MQMMFDDVQYHWVLSTLNEEVFIHDSLWTATIVLEKQLVRLYGPTMSSGSTGPCISASSVQQQKGIWCACYRYYTP